MLTGTEGTLIPWRVAARAIALGVSLFLSACGGGGSSSSSASNAADSNTVTSGVSMTLSNQSLSAAATTLQTTAPVEYFSVNATGLPYGKFVYIEISHSSTGIVSAAIAPGGILPASVRVQFLVPSDTQPNTYHDSIRVLMCYDQACKQPVSDSPQTISVTYTVTKAVYTLTGLSPASVDEQSPAFTLTVQGSSFTHSSVVQWNGAARTTHFVSSSELTADILVADVAAPGTASVTVNDPTYRTHITNTETFKVIRPAMVMDSISPTNVTVGGLPFTLTVLGDGFSTQATVLWNGTALTTTSVSDKELLAQVPASDIASLGTASITVEDTTGTPQTVGPQTLTVVPVSKDAVSYQMNSAHNGSVSFNNVTLPFPSSPAWTVDVGGTPSYALIAQGEVIIDFSVTGVGDELIALDQSDGHVVWGPNVVSTGNSTAPTYDSGRIYIISGSVTAPQLEAFDAATGNQDWNTSISDFIDSIPTAADGLVFVTGYNTGKIRAFDEATGAQVWTRITGALPEGAPAVTDDGVYINIGCKTYDLRPATGEIIWQQAPLGCLGGGGGVPIVANGLVYSSDLSAFDGDVYDAESGTKEGTFAASPSPAISSSMGFFPQSGTLHGITLSTGVSQWSFTGDGTLNTAPVVVNQYVFIGGYSPNLYAIDSTTGNQVWTVSLSTFIDGPGSGSVLSDLAAGDGLLVVSAGTKVSAFVLSTSP